MTEIEAEPVVRRTVFPVRVTLPDHTTRSLAKLIVTEQRVYVFVGTPTGVECAYSAPYTAAELPKPYQPRTDLYRLTTADGVLLAERLPGCGCSARNLKSYRPFGVGASRIGA